MNILLVDDEDASRIYLGRFLLQIGHDVTQAESGQAALIALKKQTFSLVITDIHMPGMTGLELLNYVKKDIFPTPEVILITGYGDVSSVLSALRAGAYDYLQKPIHLEELEILIDKIGEHCYLKRENEALNQHFDREVTAAVQSAQKELQRMQEKLNAELGIDSLYVFSDSMKEVMRQADIYRQNPSITVLIEGETGVGKELIARFIHGEMKGQSQPFMDLNCAAITENLFESELFGYEGGAFSGALAKGQQGKLELANGGSLFLDEIGEMSLLSQAKLLRVLEERSYYKVGGLKKMRLDTRVICATNVNLAERVEQGGFRRDLFYRLQIGRIRIPPLRERQQDILPLAQFFLLKYSLQRKKKFQAISSAAADILLKHFWPGNVRELRNLMEWVSLMFDENELEPKHLIALQDENDGEKTSIAKKKRVSDRAEEAGGEGRLIEVGGFSIVLPQEPFLLEEVIQLIIKQALVLNGNNKSKTARYLTLSRRSLCYRLDQQK